MISLDWEKFFLKFQIYLFKAKEIKYKKNKLETRGLQIIKK